MLNLMSMIPFGTGAALQYGAKKVGFRTDPFAAYRFHVEIDGLIVGGFTDVSGLSMKTQHEKVNVGGRSDQPEIFISHTTYENLVLSRGMTDLDMFYGWYEQVTRGFAKKRNVTIFLLGDDWSPVTWWDVYNAIPVAWDGPSLSASGSSGAIAAEKITLAYERFERPGLARGVSALRGAATGLSSVNF
ncbi:MAG: phage tail protein [Leptonema illini]|jgi:phage tail-like protein|uniref:Phage tail protein n=1 Tax=Leptonema illini TaxID=183 RepID=A0A833LVP6_9LEPT|nr:MAG: phage tail protein [Leptonema illini]